MHKKLKVNSQVYVLSSHAVTEMKRQDLNGQNIDLFLSLEAGGSELWYQKPEAGKSATHMGTSSNPESAVCVLQSRHL